MQLAYLIGQPGAGKTTLMAAAVGDGYPLRIEKLPVVDHPDHQTAEIGVQRGVFSGTDGLSMGILPHALAALPVLEAMGRDLVAEGDRLATPKFWDAAESLGWAVTVVLLSTPDDVCAARRAARVADGGSSPNVGWLRGRITKVANLAPRATLTIDGTAPIADQVAALRTIEPFERWVR